jgi:mannitol/fructose-specific phosphotransferase system IIA component (Ntr-type)
VEIADLLTGPDAVLASVKASGKKALLAELASRAATVFKLDERKLFDRLLERERSSRVTSTQPLVERSAKELA